MVSWNPWHGCKRYSTGCLHCYVYRRDESVERDASQVQKNAAFDLPIRKKRDGSYHIPSGETVFTCFTSDFFLEEADPWRAEAWQMIRQRQDLYFFFITKRILRFHEQLPADWGTGYPNVTIGVTCENQAMADQRLPYFVSLPIVHKQIVLEPMLESIQLEPYLGCGIEKVSVGGESGQGARLMRYEWAQNVRFQCDRHHVAFHFHQTGARFEKDGRVYRIPRAEQQRQAAKSGLSTIDAK
ncbi:MAG: DUF5131 family protein [Clostridiales bacterium]|nr:DUF5131 family protein [Clostridiales bacterium]